MRKPTVGVAYHATISRKEYKDKNKTKPTQKEINGITLVALVITIIVFLILAGVTIAMLLGPNGIITRAKEAKNNWEKTAEQEQIDLANLYEEMGDIYGGTQTGWNETEGVNEPKLAEGMIPVYYDETAGKWKKADSNNEGTNKWYDYNNKQWANIATVSDETNNNKHYRTAEADTIIEMDDITAMFVWIPRYSYSIVDGYKTANTDTPATTNSGTPKIEVSFLKGTTNIDKAGTSYPKDYNSDSITVGGTTPKIVHPGFTIGEREIRGIWIAKFEASGQNENGQYVGNGSASSSTPVSPATATTVVTVKPSVPSWRYLTVGESQYRSMKMAQDTTQYGWSNVNSHLIKNSEWGAVAYLSYSKYGQVPMANNCGSYGNVNNTGFYYDMMTGAGPGSSTSESRYNYEASSFETTHSYSTDNGKLASTTGNVYGIYDMSGGNWERVAGYLDNGNSSLNTYGYSTTNNTIKYFENGKLNTSYSKYWDKYEVGEEEKNNSIKIDETETLTQAQLWDANKNATKYNVARMRITAETFQKMKNHKGEGMYETSNNYGFYGTWTDGNGNKTWNWYASMEDAEANRATYGRTWNNDLNLIGHASRPFVSRGGGCAYGTGAGVLSAHITYGNAYGHGGFRPVVVL